MPHLTISFWLKFTLESDATFGRGDGVAGVVDAEVQHDPFGLPYLGGKTLKGLLCAECAEILFALKQSLLITELENWEQTAQFLFGSAGSQVDTVGHMRVSDAQLPEDLRRALMEEFRLLEVKYSTNQEQREREWGLKRVVNLEALTAQRRQTAMDSETGAPLEHTLRTMRVILRKTPFVARLDVNNVPEEKLNYIKWLLAACTKSFRRAGTGRNRGRGRLQAELYDSPLFDSSSGQPLSAEPVTLAWLNEFEKEIRA